MAKRTTVFSTLIGLLQLVAVPGTASRALAQAEPPAGATENELFAFRHAPGEVYLNWKAKPGVSGYVVLMSTRLGWKGSLRFEADIEPGADELTIESTNGLRPGDALYIGTRREDYYVSEVIDEKRLRLTYGVQTSSTLPAGNYRCNLSGCWVKDESVYSMIATISDVNVSEYLVTGLELEKDYYFMIGYDNGGVVESYTNPVNVKLTDIGVLYDAALGSNGGYAWKVAQLYGDTPELIDGDDDTSSIRIQYNNPEIRQPSQVWRGFHRVNLQDALPIKRVEIAQDMRSYYIQARVIRLGFDDRSMLEFDLEQDGTIVRVDQGNVRHYRIPVDKVSSYVSVYVEDITNPTGNYTLWYKIGAYTDRPLVRAVKSAADLDAVSMSIDFLQNDGSLPTVFGTDEIYDNTEGIEYGWMLRAWPDMKNMFDLYRIQLGDYWPRHYGTDQIRVGDLAQGIGAGDTTLPLSNVNPDALPLASGSRLKIDDELMRAGSLSGSSLTVSDRGYQHTIGTSHAAGTPVFVYYSAGQILRSQEILPEFKVQRIRRAYASGLSSIDPDVPLNDPARTATVANVRMIAGDFSPGDVVRIGREVFLVETVSGAPGGQSLSLRRGHDGTNETYIQHNGPVGDVYKLLDYEPYYAGFKNDPADPDSYFWDNFKTSMDKLIKDGGAVPWFIVWSPFYATQTRGRVAAIESIGNGANNVLVDEYNSYNDGADWWNYIAAGNSEDDDQNIRGNMYQYYHGLLHILTGDAAGKVFYVRSHTGDRLRIVWTWEDSAWTTTDPNYVNLADEGVRAGDVYKVTMPANKYGNVTRRFWQYNADFAYNVARYVHDNYALDLAGRPIFMEYSNEPNLQTYGTWVKDAYIDSYNVLAATIRNGRADLGPGFAPKEVTIGAGSIAGGLNPSIKMSGTSGDYDLALSLVDRAPILDFISHHRYYMGTRVQKRENSWEYWMLRNYALSKGKDLAIIDSEDSVATAGGTGQEEARHWARYGVPYWGANFINSYSGDHGSLGRLAFIIHFRLHQYSNDRGLGMASSSDRTSNGEPVYDLVYWPIKMYQNHTSGNPAAPDTLARTTKGWDAYGWIQSMGTIHGQTGERKIHLVNKKETPVTVRLNLIGSASMDSVIGCGSEQTIGDGFHPPDLQGAIVTRPIDDLGSVRLPPCSANIITLGQDLPPLPRVSIRDESIIEGEAGGALAMFRVSLSSATSGSVSMNYAVEGATASAGSDFEPSAGTLTFAPNATSRTIVVTVRDDALSEPSETFNVVLYNATRATIEDGLGVGTILDDDSDDHPLSVSVRGTGSGVVTSSSSGIDCGSDCHEYYAPNTVVTLIATPESGSTFTGWGGACSGALTTCQIVMDAPKPVTAAFMDDSSYPRASRGLRIEKR